jgi:hypothetical protein
MRLCCQFLEVEPRAADWYQKLHRHYAMENQNNYGRRRTRVDRDPNIGRIFQQKLLRITWLLQQELPVQLHLRRELQALRNQREEPSRPVPSEPARELLLPERFVQVLLLPVRPYRQVRILPAFGNRPSPGRRWRERAMSGSVSYSSSFKNKWDGRSAPSV